MPKPIFFLAFANARTNYLRGLPDELRQIREALQVALQENICEVVERANVSLTDIYDIFQDPRNAGRIAVFHYAGHADDYQLLLETSDGNKAINTEGLVSFLIRQRGLSLVFLNGCCTQLQGEELSTQGIPAVVCTYQEIPDDTAKQLATRFYAGFAQGLTLEQAWLDAADEARSGTTKMGVAPEIKIVTSDDTTTATASNRAIGAPQNLPSRFPWDLLIRPGAEDIRALNLPQLAHQPLFGLPEVLSAFDLPDMPFRFLDRYRRVDAPVFFGRGNQIRDLYNRAISAQSAPVILFYGQSGVGKSSLLDAGLLPYLEAVAKVFYIRRDPLKGLLSALQESLQLDTHQQTDLEDGTLLKKTLEAQLTALRGIINTMPSTLAQTFRQPLLSFSADLEKLIAQPDTGMPIDPDSNIHSTDAILLNQWKKIETTSTEGRYIIIIDQVEEVFTRPLTEVRPLDELATFLTAVQTVFNQPTNRPRGKLILSYRKEFDANIEKAFAEFRIPKEKVFMDRLDTEGICEVVEGLTTTERLRRKYRLTVEDGLAHEMATDFLLDADSPVSTVLQIVLTKLWHQDDALNSRNFKLDDYRTLREKGILLTDFFNQQIATLRASENALQQEAEKNGLALDILNLHTTERGTAESRNLTELRTLYENRNDVLELLIGQFEQLYLLTRLDGGKLALAHDTLAPVIQSEMRKSDRPGQRALRLLETKILDFERAEATTILEEEDLMLVENGQSGMRTWLPKETLLITKSRERRAINEKYRRRVRFLLRSAAASVALLALIATFFWWKNARQAYVNALVATALQQEKENPSVAYNTILRAVSLNASDPTARKAKHDIYSNNEFYTNSWQQGGAVNKVGFVPLSDESLQYCTVNTEVRVLNRNGELVRKYSQSQEIITALYSPNGQNLVILSKDSVWVWNTLTNTIGSSFSSTSQLITCSISPDGKTLAHSNLNSAVYLTNFGGEIFNKLTCTAQVNHICFSPSGDSLITGSSDGVIQLWNKKGKLLKKWVAHADKVLSLAWLPNGSGFVSVGRDATLKIWNLKTGNSVAAIWHESRIEDVAVSANGKLILTASNDHSIRLWSVLRGEAITIYRAHTDFVNSVAFSQNNLSFISGSTDGTVKFWQTESKVAQRFDSAAVGIYGLAFSNDKKLLYGAVGSGTRELGELWNDPNFNGNLIFERQSMPRSMQIWNTQTGKTVRLLQGHRSGINAIAFSADGRYVASAGDDSTVIIRTQNDAVFKVLTLQDKVQSVVFSDDAQKLVTLSDDSLVTIWPTNNWENLKQIKDDSTVFTQMAIVGDKIMVGNKTGKINFYTLSGQLISTLQLPMQSGISSFAVSPDKKRILVGNDEGETYLLNTEGHILQKFNTLEKNITGASGVLCLTFSNDSKLIAIGTAGNSLHVFELGKKPEEQEIQNMKGKFSGVYSLQFSGDSHHMYVGCGDGVVRVFKCIAFD